ncbi:MAG: hypothetical protein JXX29_20115 [Deltaproteobacteria bacterium]|nr:hypothetical protein [Deltaproteobacteria bacterium]MBN2673998.1 hypothetical protein [Deltaproteobacteria bacterium]
MKPVKNTKPAEVIRDTELPENKSSSAVPLFIFVFGIPLLLVILAEVFWG